MVLTNREPFIYLHTHIISQANLDDALARSSSIELDIACDDLGNPYIGHALIFYSFRNLPPPQNLPLDDVIDALEQSNLFVVLDCKDERALPTVQSIIERLGHQRTMFHAWTDALQFKPYPTNIVVEPQWLTEDLPHSAILQFKSACDVPMILGVRGITMEMLEQNPQPIIDRILDVAKNTAIAINFNLPLGGLPPKTVVDALLEHDIMTLVSVDSIAPQDRPSRYIGLTDYLPSARTDAADSYSTSARLHTLVR